jgi:hypothetical protein
MAEPGQSSRDTSQTAPRRYVVRVDHERAGRGSIKASLADAIDLARELSMTSATALWPGINVCVYAAADAVEPTLVATFRRGELVPGA